MIKIEKEPLVSIIVITFNSSKYVTETLESISAQTYKNLELIVSDDCSSDDTVIIVRNWINDNHDRFIDVQLVTTEKNVGTSANCNRGIKASHGNWIRLIAGDDLMTPQSIEWQIDYLKINPAAMILIGETRAFKVVNGIRHEINVPQVIDNAPHFFDLSAKDQYEYILRHYNIGLTSGTIVNNTIYNNITLFDEKYSIIEDLPFWLNVTKAGIKYHYIKRPLEMYRVHESVSHAEKGTLFNKKFAEVRRQIINDMIKPHIKWYEFIFNGILKVRELKYWFTFKVFNNKKNFVSTIVIKILNYIIYGLMFISNKMADIKYYHNAT